MVDVEIHRLEVGASAERLAAGPGEDEDASGLVGFELLQPLAQDSSGRGVDRIAPLWPVDRQDRRSALALVANLVAHPRIVPQEPRDPHEKGAGGLVAARITGFAATPDSHWGAPRSSTAKG